MIEILIMLVVLGWFYYTARDQGRNGWIWIGVGAISYYLPVFFVGNYIAPYVVGGIKDGFLRGLLWFILAIGSGILVCYLARTILIRSELR